MSQFRGRENFFCIFFGKGLLLDFHKSERIFYLLFNEQVGNFNLLRGEYQSRNKAYTKILPIVKLQGAGNLYLALALSFIVGVLRDKEIDAL